jgi:hypothetical protein
MKPNLTIKFWGWGGVGRGEGLNLSDLIYKVQKFKQIFLGFLPNFHQNIKRGTKGKIFSLNLCSYFEG